MESSQVDQYTSAGLVSREENHIHIIEMVFRKTVNKLRNLTSRNSTASSSTANKQAGFPLVGGQVNGDCRQIRSRMAGHRRISK